MSLLSVSDVVAGYGSHTVLHGVSFEVGPGEAVSMVGLNGAGKSVTLRCISGILPPWSGRIVLEGADITRRSAEQRSAAGIATVPQGRGIFPDLSVEQNLRLGGYRLTNRTYRQRRDELVERFPILAQRAEQKAGSLSGGEQAMLAVARALLSRPRLLVLDEPTAGLSPSATGVLLRFLSALRDQGNTILMVEQNVTFALALAHRVLLMQRGQVVATASPESLTDRQLLLDALGAGELSGSPAPVPEPAPARGAGKAPARRRPAKKAAAAPTGARAAKTPAKAAAEGKAAAPRRRSAGPRPSDGAGGGGSTGS
ncbi:MAG TPA: ABC transporter ATP-binding protein [Acidimicrobiales bacterium]|nr:ABC transporter ATP-binding protein [Acidimicrobiales bacterium]